MCSNWDLGLSLALAALLAGACAEHECPEGFDKVGKACRRPDAGAEPVKAGTSDDDAGGGAGNDEGRGEASRSE